MNSRRLIASPRPHTTHRNGLNQFAGRGHVDAGECLLWVKSGHSPNVRPMSALPPKADIDWDCRDVRVVPEADIAHPVQCYADSRYGSKASIETWTVRSASGPHSSLPVNTTVYSHCGLSP